MIPMTDDFIADEPESCILIIQYPKKEYIKNYISQILNKVAGRPYMAYFVNKGGKKCRNLEPLNNCIKIYSQKIT